MAYREDTDASFSVLTMRSSIEGCSAFVKPGPDLLRHHSLSE
jgi:hypothetical protein